MHSKNKEDSFGIKIFHFLKICLCFFNIVSLFFKVRMIVLMQTEQSFCYFFQPNVISIKKLHFHQKVLVCLYHCFCISKMLLWTSLAFLPEAGLIPSLKSPGVLTMLRQQYVKCEPQDL